MTPFTSSMGKYILSHSKNLFKNWIQRACDQFFLKVIDKKFVILILKITLKFWLFKNDVFAHFCAEIGLEIDSWILEDDLELRNWN